MAEIELANIPLMDIALGDRARKEYHNLGALAEDIKEKGLIHPIAVQRTEGVPPYNGNPPYLLLAGGRRYSACLSIQLPTIPCRIYPSSLTDIDRREIELMENISREDMTWVERTQLREMIHQLKVEQLGEAKGSSLIGHSASDTAQLLNTSNATLSRDLKLARALREHPELHQAKNASEALKALERIEKRAEATRITRKVDQAIADGGGEQYQLSLINGYILEDFFEGIKPVPDKSAHLIEIDPPYGMDLHKNKRKSTIIFDEQLGHYNEIAAEEYPLFLRRLFHECSRVLHPRGWLICWTSYQWLHLVTRLLRNEGYFTGNVPAFWIKPQGQTNHPNIYLGSSVEAFVYARRNAETVLYQPGRLNTFVYTGVHQDKKTHPTERPVELLCDVIKTFIPSNSNILIPFLGSGNTLLAASNMGCTAYGFELSEAYRSSFIARVHQGPPRQYSSY